MAFIDQPNFCAEYAKFVANFMITWIEQNLERVDKLDIVMFEPSTNGTRAQIITNFVEQRLSVSDDMATRVDHTIGHTFEVSQEYTSGPIIGKTSNVLNGNQVYYVKLNN